LSGLVPAWAGASDGEELVSSWGPAPRLHRSALHISRRALCNTERALHTFRCGLCIPERALAFCRSGLHIFPCEMCRPGSAPPISGAALHISRLQMRRARRGLHRARPGMCKPSANLHTFASQMCIANAATPVCTAPLVAATSALPVPNGQEGGANHATTRSARVSWAGACLGGDKTQYRSFKESAVPWLPRLPPKKTPLLTSPRGAGVKGAWGEVRRGAFLGLSFK
jgi:hypothetical protein